MEKNMLAIVVGVLLIVSPVAASPECERLAKEDRDRFAAANVCSDLINKKIDEVENRFWRSVILAKEGMQKDEKLLSFALIDLNWIIERKPNDAQALSNRAAVYRHLKKYDLALLDVERAIEISGNVSDYHNVKGRILFETQQYNRSLQEFETALKLNPLDGNSMRGKIALLFMNNQVNEAIENLNKFSQTSFFSYSAKDAKLLASELSSRGFYQQAVDVLKNYLQKNPLEASLYYERSLLHTENKDLNSAMSDIDSALFFEPNNSDFLAHKGYIYYELGDFKRSGENSLLAIKSNGKNFIALNNLGRALYSIGESDHAQYWYLEAIKVNKAEPRPYFNVAWILERKGNYADAIKWYAECIRLSGGDEDFYQTAIARLSDLKKRKNN